MSSSKTGCNFVASNLPLHAANIYIYIYIEGVCVCVCERDRERERERENLGLNGTPSLRVLGKLYGR